MQRFHLAWALATALASTQCGRGPDTTEEPSAGAAAPAGRAPSASSAPAAAAGVPSDVAKAAVRVPIEGLPIFGNVNAPVTIVAFTDYGCPYCAKADRTLLTLPAELGDDVRIAMAMRPLAMHDHATAAARAFLAAAEQGKGEAMHARLFADQAALDDAGLVASARAIGLDLKAFETARTGPSTAAALERTEKLATSLGANGTPTFFVNGRRLMGARPYGQFRSLVEEERTHAKDLISQGLATPAEVYALMMASASPHVLLPAPASDSVVDVALDGAPARGAERAPVTIALFSDFECPYCVKAEVTLRTLEAAYPGRVKVVFKHRPLPMHDHARIAAKASLAAEAQGKFWEYHDVLVAHRDALDRASLEGYAASIGLDSGRFTRDMDDPRAEARISADEIQATKLHVEGTPTAFVNGRRISGAQPIAVFRAAVDRALAGR